MKSLSLYCTTALIASLAPAFADVSAQDVWDAWKVQISAADPDVKIGAEEMVGDTLTIKGIEFTSDMPDGSASGKVGDIGFREMGDGTVQIILAPEFPVEFMATDAGGEEFAGKLVLRSTGMEMVASGNPGAVNYDFKAAAMTMSLEDVKTGEGAMPMTATFTLNDATGQTKTETSDGYMFDAVAKAGSMDINVSISNPKVEGETFNLTGSSKDIALSEKGKVPAGVTMENLSAAITAGFDVTGSVSSGAADYQIELTGPESLTGAMTAASSTLDFAMGALGLGYTGTAKTITLKAASASLPVPVDVTLDEYVAGLQMPVLKSDTPQDVGLVTKLIGLTLNEEIWALGDPGKVLPRDPATLVIDLSGKGNFTVDLFDPIASAEMIGSPLNMESLDVNELRLAAAGADVSGKGALTFDNSGAEMGMPPMPLGTIDVSAKGINGLLDNLVAMGIIPADQMFSAKMAIGMYAKPGAEPDTLTTTVEMKEGGSVLINGMPIQ
ncbi:MAG: DUF2125 domain-containing protein [Deltaproteobacteria bacterium]